MKHRFRNDAAHRGVALILSLWALLLLSAAIFAWAELIDHRIEFLSDANSGLEAKALAHSGIAVALHPLVGIQTPLLEGTFAEGRGYKVRLVSEGGKLNVNWLLVGEDPRKLAILKGVLAARGLEFQEREELVDCLVDWVDPDNLHHINGAEEEGDYKPANRPFTSLDEIPQVKASGPLVAGEKWQDDFTIHSLGPIDLTAVPVEILQTLPGIAESTARRFIETRRGPDKIDGTKDDVILKDMAVVRSYLGLTVQQFELLNGLVSLKDPTYHIVSLGYVGKTNRQVEVVAKKVGNTPQIMVWKEL